MYDIDPQKFMRLMLYERYEAEAEQYYKAQNDRIRRPGKKYESKLFMSFDEWLKEKDLTMFPNFMQPAINQAAMNKFIVENKDMIKELLGKHDKMVVDE